MVSMDPGKPTVVIFDLDGTLLDTESLLDEVTEAVVARYGKELTLQAKRAGRGKRPLDAWQAAIDICGINATPQELFDASEPLLTDRWHEARLLPGVERLTQHLKAKGVTQTICTSTPRSTYNKKMKNRNALRDCFPDVICGDEVMKGKPDPEIYLKMAERLNVEPAQCVVFEDAMSGVDAALAAGMQVIGIPSATDRSAFDECKQTERLTILASMLDFCPAKYNLPAFDDVIPGLDEVVIPVSPSWQLQGKVVKGFGRGSKELGIPTANLCPTALGSKLGEAVTGIYCGWASIGDSPEVYKMVMSIGWNPFYKNKEKTAEPWILHDFEKDFYDEHMRLVVCGYLRPEANFTSLEGLITRIRKDGEVSKAALDDERFLKLKGCSSLAPQTV